MNRDNDQISSAQLAAILSITMMGIGILSLPRALVEKVGPDSPLIIAVGVVMTLVLGLIVSNLVNKFPKDTIVEFGNSLLGKFLGTLMSLGLFGFYLIFTAIEVRMFGEIMKTYLLINTPIEILMVTYMLAVIYVVRSGIETIARMSQILFPIVLFTSVITMFPLLSELDFTHFLPVLKTPPLKLLKAIPLMVFSFLGVELTLLFSTFVVDSRNIKKYVSFSIMLIGFIYFNTTVVTIARFGLVETSHIIWPALEIFKTVDIPGAFIENIHIYTIAIWVFSVLMTTVGFYFASSFTLSRIIKSAKQDYLVLPLAPFVYYLALIPDGVVEAMEILDMFAEYLGTLYLVIVPIGLFGLSMFKKNKGEKKNA